MAITKNGGRQNPLVARVEFNWTDLGTPITAGTVLEAIDLPVGAIVLSGYLKVLTAWAVAGGTATADIGDATDPDRYTNAVIDLMATAGTTVELDIENGVAGAGFEYTAADTIDLTLVTTVAVSTAGAAELVVTYIIADRATEVQPV